MPKNLSTRLGTKSDVAKGFVIPYIRNSIHGKNKLAEPFVGLGTVTMEVLEKLDLDKVHLNDADVSIVSVWKAIANHIDLLIDRVRDIHLNYDLLSGPMQHRIASSTVVPKSEFDLVELAVCRLAWQEVAFQYETPNFETPLYSGKGEKWDSSDMCNQSRYLMDRHARYLMERPPESGMHGRDGKSRPIRHARA